MTNPLSESDKVTKALGFQHQQSPSHGAVPARFDLAAGFQRKQELTIGRNPDSDIWLDHPAVSRIHASIRPGQNGGLVVRDEHSTHGISIDGKPVDGEAPWLPGTTLHVGPQALWLEDERTITTVVADEAPGLEAKGLTVRVPGREIPILDKVSFAFRTGQFVCVLGPSGAGKTTLVKCLQGQQPTSGGTLRFGGNPIHSNPAILNGLVGYVPQQMPLHETLSARQVVTFAALLRLPADTTRQEIDSRVTKVLREMRLDEIADQKVSSLSGGEHKRVELASELVVDPAILVVDEATSSLDPASEARVMDVLAETARKGKLVVCVTHHMDNIGKADLILMLGFGKVVYLGPPDGIRSHLGVNHLADAFVRMEDEGVEKWTKPEVEPPDSAGQPVPAGAVQVKRRSVRARVREISRQIGILARREFAAAWSDRRYLLLATIMPAVFALVLIACHWMLDFSKPVLQTRAMNEDEKSTFAVFWPMIHEAAKGNIGDDETLTVKAQLAFLLENRPRMRDGLASDELDRVVKSAISGGETVFPDRFIKNPVTTYKFLSVQTMALTFMGMFLGLTLIVRDSAVFLREQSVGLSASAYIASKMAVLLVVTCFQTVVFLGCMYGLLGARELANGLELPPIDYRIGLIEMVPVNWVVTFACGCMGVLVGAFARKADRAIIILGGMMVLQLTLGSALGLTTTPLTKGAAFLTSPTYWGLRATQFTPMQDGVVLLPRHMQILGNSFIQSVPLAIVGLVIQIIIYIFLAWWLLKTKSAEKD